jgi:hypothetical protein
VYDVLTARYRFACPARGEARVTLSAFRRVERLPGAEHPAVFRVTFACGCGDEHVGLVAHDDLDWAPLGLHAGLFLNVMTDRLDDVANELAELAARRIGAGEWPWSFFCYPEEQARLSRRRSRCSRPASGLWAWPSAAPPAHGSR